jgi:lactoylglutathione lyase
VKIRAIDFVLLNVSDIERSSAFYRETLGLDFPISQASGPWMEFDSSPVAMALFRDPSSAGRNAIIALAVEDVSAAVDELRARGVQVVMEGIESPVCYQAVIQDPDGNLLLLHQRKDGTAG